MLVDAAPSPATWARALVVDDDVMIRELVRFVLEDRGVEVLTAESGADALHLLEAQPVDLVMSDIMMTGMDGFALVSKLRSSPLTRGVPVIFLTSRIDPTDAASGLRLSAEDFVRKPFDPADLARKAELLIQSGEHNVERLIGDDGRALGTDTFRGAVEVAATRPNNSVMVGAVVIDEYDALHARFGDLAHRDLTSRLLAVTRGYAEVSAVGHGDQGHWYVLVEGMSKRKVRRILEAIATSIGQEQFSVAGEHVGATPSVGWTEVEARDDAARGLERAEEASRAARRLLDLQPLEWSPDLRGEHRKTTGLARWSRWEARVRTGWQICATFVLGSGLPFAFYMWLHTLGYDLTTWFYTGIVIALVVTGLSIWLEGFYALDPERPPAEPSAPPPPATAIVAAYLPNEAATIVATIESFLRIDYPHLQVIVAYNTPRGYHVERTLREMASRDPRLLPLRVAHSTSKAQNVNAALRHASGEFVGVFDADHHPDPGSFHRAWRWLSNGWDVVQGHCVIRNGDASRVARTVAVEFESIYAVSHPGRNQLHGFGIFGGSNGYWRTETLRATRLHGFMLTEDIDSSLRVITGGGKIANDPALISRELAPTTIGQLWTQRMRWAQGWFQVSLKHLKNAWLSRELRLRQKLGMTFLLGWREVYPWISIQMVPLIAFMAWREGGVDKLSWIIALFVLTTLFTFSVGPGQVLFAHRLAVPEIRRRRRWFWHYLWISSLAYTEWKNIITRVAQFKEITGERQWHVTPRTAAARRTTP